MAGSDWSHSSFALLFFVWWLQLPCAWYGVLLPDFCELLRVTCPGGILSVSLSVELSIEAALAMSTYRQWDTISFLVCSTYGNCLYSSSCSLLYVCICPPVCCGFLRAFASLAEDLSLVTGICVRWLTNACNSSSRMFKGTCALSVYLSLSHAHLKFTLFFNVYGYLVCIYVRTMCVPCTCRDQRGYQIPWAGVTDVCELLCGCWESNPGHLKEHPVLLTAKTLFSPKHNFFWRRWWISHGLS